MKHGLWLAEQFDSLHVNSNNLEEEELKLKPKFLSDEQVSSIFVPEDKF